MERVRAAIFCPAALHAQPIGAVRRGGAGRGIGAATAIALAEAGADVVISARTAEQLDEVAAKVTAAGRRDPSQSHRDGST